MHTPADGSGGQVIVQFSPQTGSALWGQGWNRANEYFFSMNISEVSGDTSCERCGCFSFLSGVTLRSPLKCPVKIRTKN